MQVVTRESFLQRPLWNWEAVPWVLFIGLVIHTFTHQILVLVLSLDPNLHSFWLNGALALMFEFHIHFFQQLVLTFEDFQFYFEDVFLFVLRPVWPARLSFPLLGCLLLLLVFRGGRRKVLLQGLNFMEWLWQLWRKEFVYLSILTFLRKRFELIQSFWGLGNFHLRLDFLNLLIALVE